jgi:two-component system catabolic regulation response regulator CreB/two-component system response regulator ChvI
VQNSSGAILLVDDESDIATLFQYYLESSGYRVKVYNDPLNALSEFRAGLYDLALLDVRMPHMSGFELYEKIHRIDTACRVCFVTAFEIYYRSLKEFFPNLDVTCFIRKPVSKVELLRHVAAELIS